MSVEETLLYLACKGAKNSSNRVFEEGRDLIGVAGFICGARRNALRSVCCEVIATDNATAIGLSVLKLLECEQTLAVEPVVVVTKEKGAVRAFNEYALNWKRDATRKLSPQKVAFVKLRLGFQDRLSFRMDTDGESDFMKYAKKDAEGPNGTLVRRYYLSLQQGGNLVLENLDSVLACETKGLKPGDCSIR